MDQQYQVGQEIVYQGRPHRIVSIENGEAELEEIDAPETGGPPSPSVMDERGLLDKAADYLPAIAGTLGSLTGAKRTPTGMAITGAAGATGELARQGLRRFQGRDAEVPDTLGGSLMRAAQEGGVQAGAEGLGRGLMATLRRAAPGFMDAGLGAQKALRNKFSKVDLADVALREGTLRDPFPKAAITARSAAADAAVPASGRAADAAGTPRIQSGEVIGDLMKLRDRFMRARQPDKVAAIDDQISQLVKEYGTTGIGIEDALIRKAEVQGDAKAALASAANPRTAAVGTRAANAEQKTLTRTMHDPTRVPADVGKSLTRSQELMALKKAVENIPKPSIGGPAGLLTYGARKTAVSPKNLGRYGIAARRMSSLSGTPAATGADAVTRLSLMELLDLLREEQ